jgi:murein DD-endopeptidase MepM/ murein hydrolase activator NlpD
MHLPRARTLAAFVVVIVLAHPSPAGAVEPPAPCLLAPLDAPVADPFREPGCRWCPGNRGLEYAVGPGRAVRAGAAGTVSFAGSVVGTRYVVVEHSSGLRTTYGRLGSTAVVAGQVVGAGTVVGTTGEGLFFGVRRGDVYLDPAGYLVRNLRRPRLVPSFGGPRRPGRPAGVTCTAARSHR